MAGSGIGTWLLVGMVVIGIYVLPSVTAKFSGSHTMEFNGTGTQTNASLMLCGQCHEYIETELNLTTSTSAGAVLQAHVVALMDRSYAQDDANDGQTWLIIGNYSNIDTPSEVCPLCHATELDIAGSHTQVVTRLCTDADCHGYNETAHSGSSLVFGGQNITKPLSMSNDVHSGWFNAMEDSNSGRPKANVSVDYQGFETADGSPAYGQGYLTCLACHTHFGMNMNLTRPQSFNINVSISSNGSVTVDSTVAVNETDTCSGVLSIKAPGVSVWQ